MKVNLISFQEKAVQGLREDIADALDNYRRRGKTQVVSLQAPTGAGKTIIAAALIENMNFKATKAARFPLKSTVSPWKNRPMLLGLSTRRDAHVRLNQIRIR